MGVMAWMLGAALINVVAASALVVGVYSLMERHVGLGAFAGIGLGAVVIYVEATLGEQWFAISVPEMKLLVIAAAVGAAVGVVGTVLTVKPELD